MAKCDGVWKKEHHKERGCHEWGCAHCSHSPRNQTPQPEQAEETSGSEKCRREDEPSPDSVMWCAVCREDFRLCEKDREIKALQDRIEELEKSCDTITEILTAECHRLDKDRERMDWLETWSPRIYFNAAGNWAIERPGEETETGVTLTEAIDKARK